MGSITTPGPNPWPVARKPWSEPEAEAEPEPEPESVVRAPYRLPSAAATVGPMPLLSIDSLGVRRDGHWTLCGVSFAVEPGQAWGIVGESGAGKTTLMNLALGLLEPDEGRVLLEGSAWSGLPEKRRRRWSAPASA